MSVHERCICASCNLELSPWQRATLKDWTILVLNHFMQAGSKRLYVLMARKAPESGLFYHISASDSNEALVWSALASAATPINASVESALAILASENEPSKRARPKGIPSQIYIGFSSDGWEIVGTYCDKKEVEEFSAEDEVVSGPWIRLSTAKRMFGASKKASPKKPKPKTRKR